MGEMRTTAHYPSDCCEHRAVRRNDTYGGRQRLDSKITPPISNAQNYLPLAGTNIYNNVRLKHCNK